MSALLRSAQFRATAQATAIVAIALLLGAIALLWLLSGNLRSGVDSALVDRADSRVRLVEAGVDPATIENPSGDESFVWIGSREAVPVAVGGNQLTNPASVIQAAGTDRTVRSVVVAFVETDYDTEHGLDFGLGFGSDSDGEDGEDDDDGEDGEDEIEATQMRVVGATAVSPSSGETLQIVAGSDLRRVDATLATAQNLLLVGLPLAIALVAGVAWVTLGRAFGPVEKLRSTAAEITGTRLDERLPRNGSGDEIDRLGETMNGMLDRLAEHDQRQKRFTSDASHELKTPVANLRAIVETSDPESEPWDSIQSRLVGEAERMTDLVDDLLFVATRDEHAPDTADQSVHLDDIVFDEAAALKSRTSLRIDVSAVTPATVTGNAADLRRAIRNLADNAARYAASSVVFAIATTDGTVEVSIADDGPGIKPADREVVFERFGRTDESRDRSIGGTGLGLSIVREIASAHNGTVAISANGNGNSATGTTVTISLPVRQNG